MKRVLFAGLAVIVALLSAGVLTILLQPPTGIVVNVTNRGTTTIRDVEARTTSGAYAIGDLEPGAVGSTAVGAASDSHCRVAWTDADGARHESSATGYFEGSHAGGVRLYVGSVDVVISAAGAEVSSDISINAWSMREVVPPKPRPPR